MIIVNSLKNLGKGKYEVSFDNNKKIIVNEDFVVKYRLVKNKEITEDVYKEIEKELSYSYYYNRLLIYANSYLKSKYEYKKYLEKIETPLEYIEIIINDLISKKYISDDRYAKEVTNHYLKLGYGKKMIRQKLLESKVSNDLISEAIESIDDFEYEETAKKTMMKKIKTLKGELDFKNRQKLYLYMQNRGFEVDLINGIINNNIYE